MRFIAISCILLASSISQTVSAAGSKLPAAAADAFDSYSTLPSLLVPVLQQAQSKESADATAPDLHKAMNHIYTTREKLHQLPRLTPSQNEEVRVRYGQKMRQEWAKLYEEIMRLRNNNCFQSVALAREFRLMCMMIEK